MGVAACWLGGARAVAAPLYRRAADGVRRRPRAGTPRRGRRGAGRCGGDVCLGRRYVDADPHGIVPVRRADRPAGTGRGRTAVDEAIMRTGRALGPGPLVLDEQHARAVADLTIYVRQSHAERDLAALGAMPPGTTMSMTEAAFGHGSSSPRHPVAEGGTPVAAWLSWAAASRRWT